MKKILTNLQQAVLTLFFKNPLSNAYFLTGGTALSGFYFQHRVSIDLDLFTLETIEIHKIQRLFRSIAQKTQTTLTHRVSSVDYHEFYLQGGQDTLKIDIVRDIPVHFGNIETFDHVRVDAIENIGSNKICAIFGRVEAKDFIDLYFILKKRFSFEKLLEEAKQKDVGLSEFYFAHMLREVKNISILPKILVPFSQKDMEQYFLALADQLLLEAKPVK